MHREPSERDPFIDGLGGMLGDFAMCLVVFFVLPPALTVMALSLMAWVR